MELIEKAAIVAEIERIKEDAGIGLCAYDMGEENGKLQVCDKLLSFIDSIETKDVDLEKEIQQHIKDCLDIKFPTTDINAIKSDVEYTARMFFELGLKAKEDKE